MNITSSTSLLERIRVAMRNLLNKPSANEIAEQKRFATQIAAATSEVIRRECREGGLIWQLKNSQQSQQGHD